MSTTPYPTLQFGHSETTEMIRETVYQFCQSELMPIADEVDAKNEFPRHLWEKMGALGMHGITVAEEDGGLGLGYLEHTSRLKKSLAPPPLSACLMAPIPISVSTNFAVGGMPSKKPNICQS